MNLVRHAAMPTLFAMAGSLALYGDSWAQTPVALVTGNAREPAIITAESGKVALPRRTQFRLARSHFFLVWLAATIS